MRITASLHAFSGCLSCRRGPDDPRYTAKIDPYFRIFTDTPISRLPRPQILASHQSCEISGLNGARYLGLDKHLGSLEPGKLADPVVLDRNPLADIHNSEHVRYTMVNGRLFEAETMSETGTRVRPRAKFFFEQ